MKKKYTHEQYGVAIKEIIPDITVEKINTIEGNPYSAIVYSFPEGYRVQIVGTRLGELDIEDDAKGILSARKQKL